MKVDMIAGALDGTGGQHVHVGSLAVALARRGHEVTVHVRRDDVGLPDAVSYAPRVTVEHVHAGPGRPVARDELFPHVPEFAGHLARRWAARPPDVVHAHYWISGLAALRAVRGLDVPVVLTFHTLGEAEGGDAERIRSEARAGREAAAVIATCTDEVAELGSYGVLSGAIRLVPCGVDVSRFRPEGPVARRGNRPRVLTVGGLAPHRGVDTVVEALCHVPDAELVVVGGPGRADLERDADAVRLRRLALARGVAGRVVFAGRVPHEEVPALIRSADVVVSVPSYEPSGLVAVEAMACGAPLVVSSVGGHLDTVVDGVTGLYVPPRVPSALAGRLRRLLTDPRLGPSLGAAAVTRARERYPWTRIAASVETVYERVAGARDAIVMADETR